MSQANANGVKNVVLVHGGFVDGSGWQGVYGSSPKFPVKAVRASIASPLSYATSSSFAGTAIVARSDCSCRRIAAVIGIPRQCFDAVMRVA